MQRGMALWYNLKKSGKGDYMTRHAGCPVLAGDKWGKLIGIYTSQSVSYLIVSNYFWFIMYSLGCMYLIAVATATTDLWTPDCEVSYCQEISF